MLLQFVIFGVGLLVLLFGADWLVRGASILALRFGIRPLVVGLTVVALGTSMPEFLINFMAAVTGEDSLALGNIVGSNIANIAMILGASAILLPLAVSPGTLRKEYPILLGVMLLFYYLSLDGVVSRLDGLALILGLFGFLLYLVIDARNHAEQVRIELGLSVNLDEPEEEILAQETVADPSLQRRVVWQQIGFIFGGMIALAIGAKLMVMSAVTIAAYLDVPSIVVGLTVVAIGTSLPELAASVMCALNKQGDMTVGNVLGSNLLNVLFVVGLVSMIRPLQVDAESLSIHFPVMIVFTLLLLPLAWTRYQITRLEGGVLISGYIGYMVYLVLPYV